jgi:hypothetical protein
MTDMTKANAGRLQKALGKQYRFSSGVMTLGVWLKTANLTHKTVFVQRYSTNRIHLEYREINKLLYMVWAGPVGIDVPKIVWDSLDLPDHPIEVVQPMVPSVSYPYKSCATCSVRTECSDDNSSSWFDANCSESNANPDDEPLTIESVGCAHRL